MTPSPPFLITPPITIKIDTSKDNITTGKALWSALNLKDDIFKPTKEIIPIIIESDNPKILQLPWELLYHPVYGELAKHPNFTLSRRIPNLPDSSAPLEKRPLRVLFFSTLPDDIGEKGRLAVEHEQEVVLETIMPYRQEGLIDIKMPNDGRFESLKKLIVSYEPDMVFLSGHSGFSDGKGSFLFEDKRGLGVDIDEEELSSAFVGSSVECVVLSSCQSAQLSHSELESGLLMRLAFYGIKNVIGMSQSIYDQAGVTFAREFMKQVATKNSIAYAVQKGREEVAKLDATTSQHWHLPLLVSQDIHRDLVDWDFEPTPPSLEKLNQKLNQVLYPSNYIGRRKEFRAFYNYLYRQTLKKLLLYGEGGIGKTAMVAKFGLELREEGYKVFDYSLKHGGDFDDFLFDIELELSEANAKKFTLIKERCHDEACVAKRLAKLLLTENKKVAFIFDNLESVQDPTTKELTDKKLKSWIEALSEIDNVVVLLTSRWLLPNCQHAIALNRPLKSDFLYFLSSQNINFSRKDKLDKIYQTFGGNYRGVEFFLSAIEGMRSQDEDAFLEKIAKATDKMKIDMAIEQILSYLSQEERGLLEKLSVYDVPVPKEGVVNIALDLPQETVERLVSFSLVEKSYNPIYEVNEYQISALVYAFIGDEIALSDEVIEQSADYLLWLFLEERKTVAWALVAYEALKRVGNIEALEVWLFDVEEDRGLQGRILNDIAVQNIYLANYSTALCYLEESLNIARLISNKLGEGRILNNISEIYKIQNNLPKTLECLEMALEIVTEVSDKIGEGATLNNIGQIYHERGDIPTALNYLEEALKIQVLIEDKFGEANTRNSISQIYHDERDLEKALEYLEQSLKIQVEIDNKLGEGITLNNISQIYIEKEDLLKALEYADSSLEIHISIEDKLGICTTLFNIGHIHLANNKWQEALGSWFVVYKTAQEIGYTKVLEKLNMLAKNNGFENFEVLIQKYS